MTRMQSTRAMTERFAAVSMRLRQVAACAAIAVGLLAPAVGGAAPHTPTTLVCTNSASGAAWRIRVDFIGKTVDSNPARISAATIAWHDRADGGHYSLDRRTGNLTVVFASSTGGYLIHDHCVPDRS